MSPSLLPVYRRSALVIERGEGCYLFSPDGTRYLDFAAGIAVNSLGHCHPELVRVMKAQSEILWHCSNMYRTIDLERLADRFTALSFADKIFFCNSGTEAVECGLKMIRKFHDGNGDPDRYRVIVMEGGFHGRTLACISAGGNEIARQGFEPLVDGFDRVAFNDLAAVKNAIGAQTAAILVEPVQGEGGIRMASPEFMLGLRELANQHGLLLFVDEVQCGMGRTGALFTHEQMGVVPDIVTLAKGIGNGFPLAACLTTNKVAEGMSPGTHGSTYGANPMAMAIGNAVLDVILAPGFLDQVKRVSAGLIAGLQALQSRYPHIIGELRGVGLMLGLKMKTPHHPFVERLREKGLLTAPSTDNVIRILPPLIIEQRHVDEALAILESVCQESA